MDPNTENHEDLDSRASGTKTNGGDSSDNEAESSVNESGNSMQKPGVCSSAEKREGVKRKNPETGVGGAGFRVFKKRKKPALGMPASKIIN